MKILKKLMGMPITVDVVDEAVTLADIKAVFDYFQLIDNKFSIYKPNSEISRINQGKIPISKISPEMKQVFKLARQTKIQSNGYFDINYKSQLDPSGIVKGWAILNASKILRKKGFKNFYIEAGGDIQSFGLSSKGQNWKIGIRNPFNLTEIIKVISPQNRGVATSGNYLRGEHIYDPVSGRIENELISLTVIAPDIYQADRFATAAFAMGKSGINFINNLKGFECLMIDKEGLSIITPGFNKFVI